MHETQAMVDNRKNRITLNSETGFVGFLDFFGELMTNVASVIHKRWTDPGQKIRNDIYFKNKTLAILRLRKNWKD